MATYTPNDNLKKPAGTDYVLVGDLNENMDKLDAITGKLSLLETSVKTSLVNAINEARTTAGDQFAPYIGTNGDWYEWHVSTTEFVDTGVAATGTMWYTGTAITGTSTTAAVFDTDIAYAHKYDLYLNTSTSNIYVCDLSGDDTTAKWKYLCNIKGNTGDAAGFGTPTASASGLPAGAPPTVSVTASGEATGKVFAFAFGIPAGIAAGFGTPTAAVEGLGEGVDPNVSVTASGENTAKVFNFAFGIPKGDTGTPGTGNNWYSGAAITGISETPTAYATGIEATQVGDMYLNTGVRPDTGRVYECTVGGDAETARWRYLCLIRGADGEGVGDMLKTDYDSDADGTVNSADTATAVVLTDGAEKYAVAASVVGGALALTYTEIE